MNRASDRAKESIWAVVWHMYQPAAPFLFHFGKTELDSHSAGVQAEFMETRLAIMTTDLVVEEGGSSLACIIQSNLQIELVFKRSVSDMLKVLLFPLIPNLHSIDVYKFTRYSQVFSYHFPTYYLLVLSAMDWCGLLALSCPLELGLLVCLANSCLPRERAELNS